MTARNQYSLLTRAESDRIVELYTQGASIMQIAQIVQRGDNTVRRALIREQVPMRHPGRRRLAAERIAKQLVCDDPELAYTGGWRLHRGVWKPTRREAS